MELRVEPFSFPEAINFNFEELKKELAEKVEFYKTLIYTDKDIKSAKTDVANLRKLIKAMSDERIRIKKQCLQPYEVFEDKVNQLTAIVNEPIALINEQIKTYEEQQKQEKKQKIEEFFSTYPHPEWLKLSQIWEERWLNASVSLKRVQEEIDGHVDNIEQDIDTLSDLPEFAFEAIETYKTTLDLNKSIAEGHRLSEMQKRKAEQERIKAEKEKAIAEQERLRREQEEERARLAAMVTPEEITESAEAYREAANVGGVHMSEELSMQYQAKEEVVQSPKELPTYVCFKALLTVSQALELKEFFESKNIEFSRI